MPCTPCEQKRRIMQQAIKRVTKFKVIQKNIPKRVIIVPYRNRENHKIEFKKRMEDYFKGQNDIEIYFSHQVDNRPFNRGAMKNIGFLAIKKKYPNEYKNITFIFHDVDTWPITNGLIPYETKEGTVAHYYGHKFALGGIFAIKGSDFEKSNGFPNFWGWGMEDNLIQDRCLKQNIKIDRSIFFYVDDLKIVRVFDGYNRIVNKREPSIYKFEEADNMNDIKQIEFNIINDMINITHFKIPREHDVSELYNRDIRLGTKLKIPSGMFRKNWSLNKIIYNK